MDIGDVQIVETAENLILRVLILDAIDFNFGFVRLPFDRNALPVKCAVSLFNLGDKVFQRHRARLDIFRRVVDLNGRQDALALMAGRKRAALRHGAGCRGVLRRRQDALALVAGRKRAALRHGAGRRGVLRRRQDTLALMAGRKRAALRYGAGRCGVLRRRQDALALMAGRKRAALRHGAGCRHLCHIRNLLCISQTGNRREEHYTDKQPNQQPVLFRSFHVSCSFFPKIVLDPGTLGN